MDNSDRHNSHGSQSGGSYGRFAAMIATSTVIMFGLMLLGLAWLILYYLAGDQLAWLGQLGPWNYAIGFSGMILGLLMTMGWR